MQILVVAAFVVVMALTDGPARPGVAAPRWALLGGVFGYVALGYAATRLSASLGLRRLLRGGGSGKLGRTPAVLALATQVYLVAALGGLMLLGWGSWLERALNLGWVPLVGKALALSPFVVALVAYWWAIYPLERAMRGRMRAEMAFAGEAALPTWSRREYLSFNLRHSLLFVAVPAGMMVLALDVLALLEPRLGPEAVGAAAIAVGGGILLMVPVMIVRIWRTRPLPAGPLRRRLEGLCRRTHLRYREILVWDTGGVIVNAAVMGLIPRARYVLLSDALLDQFHADAVESIFAHEAGHVVHHHILHMLVFTAGLGMLCGAVGQVVAAAMKLAGPIDKLPIVLGAAALWLWLFGRLSRRFERQADVFSASAIRPVAASRPEAQPAGPPAEASDGDGPGELTPEGVRLFSDALLAVARMNGIRTSQRNFRHGSIRRRLDVLAGLLGTGRGRALVDRKTFAVKLAVWAMLAAGIAAMLAARLAR